MVVADIEGSMVHTHLLVRAGRRLVLLLMPERTATVLEVASFVRTGSLRFYSVIESDGIGGDFVLPDDVILTAGWVGGRRA